MALICEMKKDCVNPVTHIGERGFVYCAEHAPLRQGWERVRRVVPWELKLLLAGEPIPSYKRGRKPVVVEGLQCRP